MKESILSFSSFLGIVLFWFILATLSSTQLGVSSSQIQKGGKSRFILAWTYSFLDERITQSGYAFKMADRVAEWR